MYVALCVVKYINAILVTLTLNILPWPILLCYKCNNVNKQGSSIFLTSRAVASLTVSGKSFTFLIFPQIAINFFYFSSNVAHFLPHFGSPAGWLAHREKPWLCHCLRVQYISLCSFPYFGWIWVKRFGPDDPLLLPLHFCWHPRSLYHFNSKSLNILITLDNKIV